MSLACFMSLAVDPSESVPALIAALWAEEGLGDPPDHLLQHKSLNTWVNVADLARTFHEDKTVWVELCSAVSEAVVHNNGRAELTLHRLREHLARCQSAAAAQSIDDVIASAPRDRLITVLRAAFDMTTELEPDEWATFFTDKCATLNASHSKLPEAFREFILQTIEGEGLLRRLAELQKMSAVLPYLFEEDGSAGAAIMAATAMEASVQRVRAAILPNPSPPADARTRELTVRSPHVPGRLRP